MLSLIVFLFRLIAYVSAIVMALGAYTMGAQENWLGLILFAFLALFTLSVAAPNHEPE